jgi:hypothetical protein
MLTCDRSHRSTTDCTSDLPVRKYQYALVRRAEDSRDSFHARLAGVLFTYGGPVFVSFPNGSLPSRRARWTDAMWLSDQQNTVWHFPTASTRSEAVSKVPGTDIAGLCLIVRSFTKRFLFDYSYYKQQPLIYLIPVTLLHRDNPLGEKRINEQADCTLLHFHESYRSFFFKQWHYLLMPPSSPLFWRCYLNLIPRQSVKRKLRLNLC